MIYCRMKEILKCSIDLVGLVVADFFLSLVNQTTVHENTSPPFCKLNFS